MSSGRSTRRHDPDSGSAAVRAAVAALCAAPVLLAAQTMPYESSHRGQYGSQSWQDVLPSGTVVEPRLEGAIQYFDNLTLAEDGEPQESQFGLEVVPGIYTSYSSDAVTAALDYALIGRIWEDNDFNSVSHRLAANGRWIALPELFYLDGQASYNDAVIDPAQGLNYGGRGIFGSSNLQERATASIAPTLHKEFRRIDVLAQYRYGRVWYLDQPEPSGNQIIRFGGRQDSQDHFARFRTGLVPSASTLTGGLYYEWQRSEYERAIPYEYERAGLDYGWQFSRSLSLVGDAGLESDLTKSTTQGGLDSDFWSAGLRWEPGDRMSAEARVGNRFFGNSYFFSFHRQARFLRLDASYEESPTVQTRRLTVGDFDPGDLPPIVDPDIDPGVINTAPYVLRAAQIALSADGTRTRLRLVGFGRQKDYLRVTIESAQQDEETAGIAFDANRRLASNLSLDFRAAYTDREVYTLVREPLELVLRSYYDTQFTFRVNRDIGPKLLTTAEAGYLNRSGSRDYDGWWVGLRVLWSPYATDTER